MSKMNSEEEQLRVIRDIFRVMQDHKMYINEKRYLTETIMHLYKVGYYEDHITIGEEKVNGACK